MDDSGGAEAAQQESCRGINLRLIDHIEGTPPVGPGPVNHEGLPFNGRLGNEAPEPAVIAVIPIVAHDQVPAFGDCDRPVIVLGAGINSVCRTFGVHAVIIRVGSIVDEELFINYLHLVARNPYDALNKIFARIHRIDKDYDITTVGRGYGDNGLADEGELHPVYEFIHQYVVAYEEGRLHGTGRNLEGLNYERSDEQGQQNGDGRGLGIFPQGAFLLTPDSLLKVLG